MDQALIKLLKLRLRGAVRRSFRGVKTVRGAIFFLLGLGAMLMWLGPQVMVFFVAGHAPVDPQVLRDVLPLVLLGLLLMSMLGAARMEGIHFTAAEVDFLFSGPFYAPATAVYKLIFRHVCGVVYRPVFLDYADALCKPLDGGIFGLFPDDGLHAPAYHRSGAGRPVAGPADVHPHAQGDDVYHPRACGCDCRAPASRFFRSGFPGSGARNCAVRPSGFGSLCRWNRLSEPFPPRRSSRT